MLLAANIWVDKHILLQSKSILDQRHLTLSNCKEPSRLPSPTTGLPRHSPNPAAERGACLWVPRASSPWQFHGKRGQVQSSPESFSGFFGKGCGNPVLWLSLLLLCPSIPSLSFVSGIYPAIYSTDQQCHGAGRTLGPHACCATALGIFLPGQLDTKTSPVGVFNTSSQQAIGGCFKPQGHYLSLIFRSSP